MTQVTHISGAQSGLNSRLGAILDDLRGRIARRRLFRDTYRELAQLSDRELSDLGLSRSMIRRVAWQAVYEG